MLSKETMELKSKLRTNQASGIVRKMPHPTSGYLSVRSRVL